MSVPRALVTVKLSLLAALETQAAPCKLRLFPPAGDADMLIDRDASCSGIRLRHLSVHALRCDTGKVVQRIYR